jgi:hypothetical protein
MPRLAALLSLVAALSGSPLRQAEAASDFSRTQAETFQADRLESPDGGVGDDAGDSIQSGSQAGFAVDLSPSADPLLPPPSQMASPLSPEEAEGLRATVWWPSEPPNLRHAWLQIFLF